jgi:ABC-2 type transport system permease protein
VLYLTLIALLARHRGDRAGLGAATGAVLAVLYGFPITLAFVSSPNWQHRLERWTPTTAGPAIEDTTGAASSRHQPVGRTGRGGDLGRRRSARW